jgi:DNA-binding transcriptional MerR regulator
MLRMPVATLRVWERRYGLTQTRLSPSGQRLYSTDDVRRLALIKQLTELGHAIGSLAQLDMLQLQRVASTHASARALVRHDDGATPGELSAPRPWRLAVIGAALGPRLQRPALLRGLKRSLQLLGPFDSIAQAAASLKGQALDALLLHEPQLHAGWLASLEAAAPALAGVPKAVLYGFAADAVCESLAAVGITLLRDPQPDIVLAQWLHHVATATCSSGQAADQVIPAEQAAPARRWDDAALVDFASRSSTVACECPRHVAELLMQLSHFESYSAECKNRSPADADLHAYLTQVTGAARAHFEAALERIALHEGLLLP